MGTRDVRKTIHSILETCNLPTAYVDNLPVEKEVPKPGFKDTQFHEEFYTSPEDEESAWNEFKVRQEIERKQALKEKLE